jgi:hypothetical protein
MEIRYSRKVPDSFRVGLDVEQAWNLHATYITSAKTPAEYNSAVAKALLCLSPMVLSGQKRFIATTFLAKCGDDALAPLWAVPMFSCMDFTAKEREFFQTYWPQQFARTPQGTRPSYVAAKRVAPSVFVARASNTKRHRQDLADLFKLDCRVKRHLHHTEDFLPAPTIDSPGWPFYKYEMARADAMAVRADVLALLAWLGRERAALLFDGTTPKGSYSPAARVLLALLGYHKWGTISKKAKIPRGYVPYAGCSCEKHLSV